MTSRLEADAVFTVDDAGAVDRPGAVEIDDGVITWVGRPVDRPPRPGTGVERLGGIVMPGLVNCHAHSPMTLVRSAGDGLPLARWLSESVWPREAKCATRTSTGAWRSARSRCSPTESPRAASSTGTPIR